MNEGKKVLFIVNKFAGTGYQPEVEGRIIEACVAHDVECTIEFTKGRGHATVLAQEASQHGFHEVIAVGGDGTLNEVAQGLIHTPMPMGIIPRGSGNGLARHLGIPVKFKDAVNALFSTAPIGMDTFTLNGKLSLNVSGIGFDGHVANLFAHKTKRGLQGYAKITIREFLRFGEFEASITINGKTVDKKAFVIAIANSSQYGNNARIAPVASVRDQLLHINLLKKVPPYRLDFVYAFFAGAVHKSPYVEMLETDHLRIHTSRPVAFHIDGEPGGEHQDFDIKLSPAALQVLVPQKAFQSRAL